MPKEYGWMTKGLTNRPDLSKSEQLALGKKTCSKVMVCVLKRALWRNVKKQRSDPEEPLLWLSTTLVFKNTFCEKVSQPPNICPKTMEIGKPAWKLDLPSSEPRSFFEATWWDVRKPTFNRWVCDRGPGRFLRLNRLIEEDASSLVYSFVKDKAHWLWDFFF